MSCHCPRSSLALSANLEHLFPLSCEGGVALIFCSTVLFTLRIPRRGTFSYVDLIHAVGTIFTHF